MRQQVVIPTSDDHRRIFHQSFRTIITCRTCNERGEPLCCRLRVAQITGNGNTMTRSNLHGMINMNYASVTMLLLLSASLQLQLESNAFILPLSKCKSAGWSTSAALPTKAVQSSLPTTYSLLLMSTTVPSQPSTEETLENGSELPTLGPDGVYHILNQAQHK